MHFLPPPLSTGPRGEVGAALPFVTLVPINMYVLYVHLCYCT